MIGFLKRLFGKRESAPAEPPAPQYYVLVKQGERGRWRWYGYDVDARLAVESPVQGYESEAAAGLAAIALIETPGEVVFVNARNDIRASQDG